MKRLGGVIISRQVNNVKEKAEVIKVGHLIADFEFDWQAVALFLNLITRGLKVV